MAAEEDDRMLTPPLRLRVRNEEVWAASMGQGYGGRKCRDLCQEPVEFSRGQGEADFGAEQEGSREKSEDEGGSDGPEEGLRAVVGMLQVQKEAVLPIVNPGCSHPQQDAEDEEDGDSRREGAGLGREECGAGLSLR